MEGWRSFHRHHRIGIYPARYIYVYDLDFYGTNGAGACNPCIHYVIIGILESKRNCGTDCGTLCVTVVGDSVLSKVVEYSTFVFRVLYRVGGRKGYPSGNE